MIEYPENSPSFPQTAKKKIPWRNSNCLKERSSRLRLFELRDKLCGLKFEIRAHFFQKKVFLLLAGLSAALRAEK
ncbi:MAG: hypothetical protein FH759_07590 [Sediminimonas qiaohouensis]|uniref:Uncharacterized protein n=1 Tax=Sediminimonas qiaohouensis TaxID=552061 RepID=A0A7C9LAW3_9RHOB|nr:hypothetical protein [Sediminimonas qiaohouensis]MTJ04538.1 hypothetical protein [Sediminimonas qiaohouensis]